MSEARHTDLALVNVHRLTARYVLDRRAMDGTAKLIRRPQPQQVGFIVTDRSTKQWIYSRERPADEAPKGPIKVMLRDNLFTRCTLPIFSRWMNRQNGEGFDQDQDPLEKSRSVQANNGVDRNFPMQQRE